jgi:hypothetical protein
MEMPTLPTDNLYKFMAIAGLLLFAATMYFPAMLQIQLDDQLIQNNESANALAADLEFTQIKIARTKQIVTNSIFQQEGKYTHSTDKLTLSYSESEIKQMVNEILELNHQNKLNLVKIEANGVRTDHLKFLIGLTKKVQYVCRGASKAGGVV